MRYLWCHTGGWLIARSDIELIRVSPEAEHHTADGGVP